MRVEEDQRLRATASGAGGVPAGEVRRLRVLIANERRDRLELLAEVVTGLGHDVIAREIYVKEVGPATSRELPDVAIVGLGLSSEHALELIGEIVREASCPVIALLHANNPAYIHEAAKRGVFAYIIEGTPEELQSAIDITLQRFTEYHNLQGAFARRAAIEQAKGILMARHGVDADKAFEMLRDHSQHNGRKLVDVAAAIVESHLLLLPPPVAAAPDPRVSRRPPVQVRQLDGAPIDTQATDPSKEGTTMTAHQNISEWHGKDLVDEAGDKVGKLEEVYVDVETDYRKGWSPMQTDTPNMIETEEETTTPLPSEAEDAAPHAEVIHQDIGEWRGRELVDRDGERIGKLEDVYFDIETDEPQFGTVKEGFLGRHLTFVPLTGITIGPDNLQMPVTAEQVKNAPNIALQGGELSQSDESALYHHYELNYTPLDNKSGRRLARR